MQPMNQTQKGLAHIELPRTRKWMNSVALLRRETDCQITRPHHKMAPLEAFNPPLGPVLAQCHPEAVTLHMKEKAFALTGDDFTVKTTSGLEVCKCKGKLLSISDKKGIHYEDGDLWSLLMALVVFTDIHNNEIFTLKNKHFTLHKSFHAEDPHGHDLFVVKGEFSCELRFLFLSRVQRGRSRFNPPRILLE